MTNFKPRNILLLLLIYAILLAGGLSIINQTRFNLEPVTFATMHTAMMLITMVAYLLIMAGNRRNKKDRGVFLLSGVGGKFLAYLVLILIFLVTGNNLTKELIITFFVLYLVFTFFLLRILFKTLKSN